MAPITVLHLMNNYMDCSISRIIQRLIQCLGQQDFEWHVAALTNKGYMQKEYCGMGLPTSDFSVGDQSPVQHIREYIQQHKIEVIHTHTPRTIFAAEQALARFPRVKHLATKHLLGMPGDRRWGLPLALVDRLSLYLPDLLVPVSQTMYRQIAGLPGLRGHTVMIRNAIPCDTFYAPEQRETGRAELGLPADAVAIGYAGRIERVKRIDLLLLAFREVLARCPQARLVVAGWLDQGDDMRTYAAGLGLEQAVIWPGYTRNVPRLMSALDIYAQPSDNEGLSLSILEAMAAGKPVISTRVGGAEEVLTDGVTGLLIQPGSLSALVEGLLKLIEQPDYARRLAETGQRHVFQEFSLQKMMDGYRAAYQRLAKAAR